MYNSQKAADCIKKLLVDKKTSAKEMCKELHLGVNTLSNIRCGDIKNIETFQAIADFFNVSVDYILGRTELSAPAKSYTSGNNMIFDRLNDLGKQKATEYINDLLENPKYTSKPQPQKGVVIVGDAFEDDVVRSAAYGGGVDDGDDEVHSTDDI